jgi:hypothetical protein
MCLMSVLLAVGCTAPNPDASTSDGGSGSMSGGGGSGGSGHGGGGSGGGSGGVGSGGGGSGGGGGGGSGGGSVNGGGSGSSLLTFAVFGDSRPPNQNDTSGYPTQVLTSIFSQAQTKGAQFVVGTGDYMFASTQAAVDAQVALFMQAQASFSGPVYHTMGNHECTGYTASNCPNGNETPNVQAFLQKFVPSGVTTPYYRVDVNTPSGKAKFLFVAANAWSSSQESWLQQQLADATTYTFVIRHEPSYDNTAPGVSPSDSLLNSAPYTMLLLGHTHEFRKMSVNQVISGNGGAPLASGGQGSNYGFLLIAQQADGTLEVSEVDVTTGNVTESWKVNAQGQAAP